MKSIYAISILVIMVCSFGCLNTQQKEGTNSQNQSESSEELIKDEKPTVERDLDAEQKLKEEEFLNEISGIWQESVLRSRVTLNLRGTNKKYELGYGVYKLKVKNINLEKKTVCFDAWYNEDINPHQMCIRMVDLGFGEYYLIVDNENFTAPWELYYIRDLD